MPVGFTPTLSTLTDAIDATGAGFEEQRVAHIAKE
jgi:hypothetical protein